MSDVGTPEVGNPGLLSVKLNRREVVKTVELVGVFAVVGSAAVKFGPSAVDLVKDSTLESSKPVVEPLPISDQPRIAEFEKRFNVRLITVREAFQKLMGREFNIEDSDEFGFVVPKKWDRKRVDFLEKCFEALPDFFYERGGNGEVLHLSLTSFGDNCPCGAQYIEKPEEMGSPKERRSTDLIMFDTSAFYPDDPVGALEVVVHELVHRVQEEKGHPQGNINKLEEIFGQSFTDVSRRTIDRLEELEREGWGNDIYHRFSYRTLYGVKDTIRDGSSRSVATEFEPVLSQIYLHGEILFKRFFRKVYGVEESRLLYSYVRDEIFGGREFGEFPDLT